MVSPAFKATSVPLLQGWGRGRKEQPNSRVRGASCCSMWEAEEQWCVIDAATLPFLWTLCKMSRRGILSPLFCSLHTPWKCLHALILTTLPLHVKLLYLRSGKRALAGGWLRGFEKSRGVNPRWAFSDIHKNHVCGLPDKCGRLKSRVLASSRAACQPHDDASFNSSAFVLCMCGIVNHHPYDGTSIQMKYCSFFLFVSLVF